MSQHGARQSLETGQSCGERGSITAFYALTILPLVLTLTVAAVDMSGWSALRDKTQQEAQRIAFLAAKVLPNTDIATAIVQQEIAKTPYLSLAGNSFGLSKSSVRVALSGSYDAVFDTFLSLAGFEKVSFRTEAAAEVQVNPMDYVLIFSDGETLRPGLTTGPSPADAVLAEPWGSPAEWPSSNYFNCTSAVPVSGESPAVDWWARWNDDQFRRWATQSCFNPAFSSVKLAAISLVDAISSSSTNRLAVIATPGEASDRGFAILRHIRGAVPAGGFFEASGASAESGWEPYQEVQTYLGDEMCVFLSEPDTAFSFRYQLPAAAAAFRRNGNSQCSSAIDFPPCGSSHSPYERLSECFIRNQLSLREAIYWRAAKLPRNGFSAKPSMTRALTQAASELLLPSSSEAVAYELQIRGQLAYKPLRKVIIIADSLPDPADLTFTDLLSRFQQSKIQLLIIGLHHPGLSGESSADFETRFSGLQSIAENFGQTGVAAESAPQTLKIFRADEPRELPQLASTLGVLAREYSLRCKSERADGCNSI